MRMRVRDEIYFDVAGAGLVADGSRDTPGYFSQTRKGTDDRPGQVISPL
jgi:hypothetical protein